MQVRFRMPDISNIQGNVSQINQTAADFVSLDLKRWAKQYRVPYTKHYDGQYVYVQFDDAAGVSHFALTYKPQYKSSSWARIEILDDSQINLP